MANTKKKAKSDTDQQAAAKLSSHGDPGGTAGYFNLLEFGSKYSVGLDLLYNHYTAWTTAEGASPLDRDQFIAQLKLIEKSIERHNSYDGEYLQGVCLSKAASKAEYERQLQQNPANDTPSEKPAVAGFSGHVDVTPLSVEDLHTWEGNVRQQKDPAFMTELEASIRQYGVLTSLVVRPSSKGGYEVLAGEQRLQAVKALVGRGDMPASTVVPCRIIDCTDIEAQEVSLAENVVRQQLNPADEFEAFQKLAEAGASISDIAHKFGVGESTVKKRLKLANVSPKIIADFRAGKCSLNQLQAFAISDDHAAQESLAAKGYDRLDTEDISDALNKTSVRASDKRVKFLGMDTLEKEGVEVVRDMIDPELGYIPDKKALQQKVDERLNAVAQELAAEGWGFVTFLKEDVDGWKVDKLYDDVPAKKIPLSDADKKTLKDLKRQEEELDNAEWGPDTYDKQDEIEKQITALEKKQDTWSDETKKKSGVIFSLNDDGTIEVRRGVKLKPEKKESTKGEGSAKTAPKTKTPAEKKNLTDDVMEELTAHRSYAISGALLADQALSFKVMAGMLICAVFGSWDHRAPYTVEIQEQDPPRSMEGKNEPLGFAKLTETKKKLKGALPKTHPQIFAWALEQKEETLRKYIAYIAAVAYQDVNRRGDEQPETKLLLGTLDLDFSNWYSPTEKNLFGKLGQEQLRVLLKEIKGAPLTPAEMKLGKDGLAKVAEIEAGKSFKAGKPWLPHPLNRPAKKKAAKPAAKKTAAKKKGGE